MLKADQYTIKIFTAAIALSIVIFIIDLMTPLGVADAISYVLVVLLTIWMQGVLYTYIMALAAIALTVIGFLLSPPNDTMLSIAIANRALAIGGIVLSGWVILRFKKSEEVGRKNKEGLAALFQYATEGLLISNSRGEMVMVNPKAEEMFGYEKGELLGRTVEDLIPSRFTGKHVAHRHAYYARPQPRSMGKGDMELFAKRKNGDEFPVEISLTHYKTEEGIFVIAFIVDITGHRQQERALKKAHSDLLRSAEDLKASNAELENFAYISSHDLQEPLRKIQAFGDRIKTMEKDNLSAHGKDYLDRVLNASARMQNLINDLLLFSRVTTRAQSFSRLDLNVVLAEVLSDLEVTIEKNRARIESGELPVVEAEPTQMRQLFQNLIVNAIKFRKEGEDPVVKISAAPSPLNKSMFDISFSDNGIGFDEKYNDRIFNIFQRLEGHRYEGSGIGLAICRKIVTRHGGSIAARSKPGEGATFVVTIPG